MSWIDVKYVGLLSGRLEKFKRKNDTTWNFKCPLCGDSHKNTNKLRGYIYRYKDRFLFKCHNCGVSTTFKSFLKTLDEGLHSEYCREALEEKITGRAKVQATKKPDITDSSKPNFIKYTALKDLLKVSQLPYDHACKKYVEGRKIPTTFHHKLFYAPKFQHWVNSFVPGKFKTPVNDPRLVIPFLDADRNLFALQGRSLKKDVEDRIRYFTIVLNNDTPRVYGVDTINPAKRVYVTEGPIDSMFLPNAIAMGGVSTVRFDPVDKSKYTYIIDNEPRNKDIVKAMANIIKMGYNIFFWPEAIEGVKDLNELVLAQPELDLVSMIEENTLSGLRATMKLNDWKRTN